MKISLLILMLFAILLALNTSAFSTNPQDYVFWDDGDQIRNGTYANAPANNSQLSSQRWTISGVGGGVWTYNTSVSNLSSNLTGNIFGNMTIRHQEGSESTAVFDLGSNLTDVTLQFTFFDNENFTDSSRLGYYGFSDGARNYHGGIDIAISLTHFWNANGLDEITSVTRNSSGWHNITFYISPNATYNVIYINGTKTSNITTSPVALRRIRMYSNFITQPSLVDYISIWSGAPENRPNGSDITPPIINISLNSTSLILGRSINITGNSSDETGLSFCRIIINQTGVNEFFNFSLSGTNGFCSQNVTISLSTAVINFTALINDTSNNKNQSSTIITVGDTTNPTLNNCTLSTTSITDASGNTINLTCDATDESNIETMVAYLNGTINKTLTFSFTQSQNIISSYIIFQSLETLLVGSYSASQVNVTDTSSNKLSNTTRDLHFSVTSAPSGGGSSGGGGGGGGSITPPTPQCKDNELLVGGVCVNGTLFNVTFKVIGLTNIQPIIFYRTCGKFQEFRQMIRTNKVLKNAEFEKRQSNTNITIIGSDALIIKKLRTSKIAERIDIGNLKLIDTTQQVARVFFGIRIINICNPLTYLFVIVPTIIIIFRKKIIKIFKKDRKA